MFLLDQRDLLLRDLKVHGDGGRLDRNTTLFFVITSVRVTHLTRLGTSNDTSLADKGIREGRLSVIN